MEECFKAAFSTVWTGRRGQKTVRTGWRGQKRNTPCKNGNDYFQPQALAGCFPPHTFSGQYFLQWHRMTLCLQCDCNHSFLPRKILDSSLIPPSTPLFLCRLRPTFFLYLLPKQNHSLISCMFIISSLPFLAAVLNFSNLGL